MKTKTIGKGTKIRIQQQQQQHPHLLWGSLRPKLPAEMIQTFTLDEKIEGAYI